MELVFIKKAFITLFVAVDPPGLAAIFLALTAHMSVAEKRQTALRATLVALGILLAVAVGGRATLTLLGISMPAFSIAGGLLLFYIAAEMVFEKREQRKNHSAESTIEHDHPRNIAVFPLAIPLIAGPGAITATILQSHMAAGNLVLFMGLVGMIIVVLLSCLAVFWLSTPLDRLMGMTGRVVLSRLLGLLLAALAVQTIGNGILAFGA